MAAMPFADSVEFAALDCSPRFARGWAKERLKGWGLGDLDYSASLVISELATNSHTATAGVEWAGAVPPVRLCLRAGPLPLGVYVLVQDAVVLLPGQADMPMLLKTAGAINWLRDAFAHLKAIGFNNASQAMFGKGGVDHTAPGVVALAKGADGFIAAAKEHKIWARDELVNPPR